MLESFGAGFCVVLVWIYCWGITFWFVGGLNGGGGGKIGWLLLIDCWTGPLNEGGGKIGLLFGKIGSGGRFGNEGGGGKFGKVGGGGKLGITGGGGRFLGNGGGGGKFGIFNGGGKFGKDGGGGKVGNPGGGGNVFSIGPPLFPPWLPKLSLASNKAFALFIA